jgi:hypothetical protein
LGLRSFSVLVRLAVLQKAWLTQMIEAAGNSLLTLMGGRILAAIPLDSPAAFLVRYAIVCVDLLLPGNRHWRSYAPPRLPLPTVVNTAFPQVTMSSIPPLGPRTPFQTHPLNPYVFSYLALNTLVGGLTFLVPMVGFCFGSGLNQLIFIVSFLRYDFYLIHEPQASPRLPNQSTASFHVVVVQHTERHPAFSALLAL